MFRVYWVVRYLTNNFLHIVIKFDLGKLKVRVFMSSKLRMRIFEMKKEPKPGIHIMAHVYVILE